MGTGKSSLARILAERWRRPMFDTDALIERRVGMTVADFFAKNGEEAFRALERECIAGWLPEKGAVVACGGGLVTGEGMVDLLKARGVVICLFATPETILRRTSHTTHRPLLQCDDPAARIEELLAQRESFYSRAGAGLLTDGRTFPDLADSIERLYRREVAAREKEGEAIKLTQAKKNRNDTSAG
ncbi:MAG: shikimate kinase [Puniceicoccales bacterium]|jgi:shikimate kinase|nr:shikimate kinase [Puniceicoccales bacterium]